MVFRGSDDTITSSVAVETGPFPCSPRRAVHLAHRAIVVPRENSIRPVISPHKGIAFQRVGAGHVVMNAIVARLTTFVHEFALVRFDTLPKAGCAAILGVFPVLKLDVIRAIIVHAGDLAPVVLVPSRAFRFYTFAPSDDSTAHSAAVDIFLLRPIR